MFEMRDGVHLATDVYLPGGQNQLHGAILITSRYDHAVFGFCSIDTSAERCL
jgi:predicted acyl esterase